MKTSFWFFLDFYWAKKYFANCVAGSRPPSYSFKEIKAFTIAEVLDLGRVTHTKVGITKPKRFP